MNNQIVNLQQQFQQKHTQLWKLSAKMNQFIENYKVGSNVHQTVRQKLRKLKVQVKNLKNDFGTLRKDLKTQEELPKEFVRMVIEMPKIYEAFWDRTEGALQKKITEIQKQNIHMKNQLNEKDKQISNLKQSLKAAEQYKQLNNEHLFKQDRFCEKLFDEDNADYLDRLQITIRDGKNFFKKITQEEDSSDYPEKSSQICSSRDKGSQSMRHSLCEADLKERKDKLKFQNIHQNKNHQQQSNNQNKIAKKTKFWNNLAKNLKEPLQKKNRSQSKQNFRIPNEISKFSTTEKLPFTSRITDFRKILLLQKNSKRNSIKN